MSTENQNETDYWLTRSLAQYIVDLNITCDREPCSCDQSSLCITEWCEPCAAKAWLANEKHRERLDKTTVGFPSHEILKEIASQGYTTLNEKRELVRLVKSLRSDYNADHHRPTVVVSRDDYEQLLKLAENCVSSDSQLLYERQHLINHQSK